MRSTEISKGAGRGPRFVADLKAKWSERDRPDPTIGTLRDLSRGLELSLAELLGPELLGGAPAVGPAGPELDPAISALLAQVGDREAQGRYLSTVVEQRWQDWQWAVSTVLAAGWRREEVLAVCDACNGLYHEGPLPGGWLAIEIEDATRLEGLVKKWEIDGDRWRTHVRELAEPDGRGDRLAHALWTISREFWAGNQALEGTISRIDRRSQISAEG